VVYNPRLPQGRGKYRGKDAKTAQGDQFAFRQGLVTTTDTLWYGTETDLDIKGLTLDSTSRFSTTALIFYPLKRLSRQFEAGCIAMRTSGPPGVTSNNKMAIYYYDFSSNEMIQVPNSSATITVSGGAGAACFGLQFIEKPMFYPGTQYFAGGITDVNQNVFYGADVSSSIVRYMFSYTMAYGDLPKKLKKDQMTLIYPASSERLPFFTYRSVKGRFISFP
jgi:phage terminase large subunit-like protein